MTNLVSQLEGFTKTVPRTGSQQIWAIGGGKGGVGKSLFAANVSIFLALLGNKVVSIDLDLGGANLHTCLGVPIPDQTLSDYVNKKVKSLESLIAPTPIKNLGLISGAQDSVGIANLRRIQKGKLMRKLGQIDADYIIFDLGAGTALNTLDFFIMAHKGILVVLPEPTSIENTYRFIKSIHHRKLTHSEEFLDIRPLVSKVINDKMGADITPSQLVDKAIDLNPSLGTKLKFELENLRPKLVVNQVRTQSDIDIGFSMKSICKKYFGVQIDYVGYLDYDSAVWQSVKKKKPLIMEFPNCKLVNNFDRIVNRLLDEEE
ncbi:MAG: P-loop NTPase [Bacteriovoracales bacterium]|nr:P-loop NTPase [Bacteriovoracales bacterium]